MSRIAPCLWFGLNGGPQFRFNEAISFTIDCSDQAEVDRLWEALSADEAAEQCGWLRDRFGVSWQIVPSALPRLLGDPDPDKARRVMPAMLQRAPAMRTPSADRWRRGWRS